MAFNYSTGTNAQGSTFNEIAGSQVNNFYFNLPAPASGPSGSGVSDKPPPPYEVHDSANSGASTTLHAILEAAARVRGQPLNWRESIVDLLKLLGVDSSYNTRTRLATLLGYQGDLSGSYNMNVWLHKRIMTILENRGGDLSVVQASLNGMLSS